MKATILKWRETREAARAQIHAKAIAEAVELVLDRYEKREPRRTDTFSTKDAAVGEVLAAEILAEETRYWWQLGRYVLAGVVIWGMVHLLFSGITAMVNMENDYVRYGTGISGPAALGAMAILATIIVALQIAVRSPHDDGAPSALRIEPSRPIARKRVLEMIAMACGVAAITVAVAAATRGSQSGTLDLQIVVGAPLGGILLAALAADASSATDAFLMTHLRAMQRKRERLLLESKISKWGGDSPKQTRWIGAGQILGVIAIVIVSALISGWILPNSSFSALFIGALIVVMAIWSANTDMELRRRGLVKRSRAFKWAVFVGAVSMAVAVASFQQRAFASSASSPSPPLYLWAMALISLSIFAAFSMARGFGSDGRPGLLRYLAVKQARDRLNRMNLEDGT